MEFEVTEVPELEGRVSLPVAGEILGVSRQRIYQLGLNERKFKSLRKISGTGDRPAAYVVDNSEVLAMRRTQCGDCQDAIAAGTDVKYCTHTDLKVPAAA